MLSGRLLPFEAKTHPENKAPIFRFCDPSQQSIFDPCEGFLATSEQASERKQLTEHVPYLYRDY